MRISDWSSDVCSSDLDAHTVMVGDERHTAERILIATGGWPKVPDIPGAREHGITSNDAFYLERLTERIVIVGGGYIGVEISEERRVGQESVSTCGCR